MVLQRNSLKYLGKFCLHLYQEIFIIDDVNSIR